MAVLYLSPRALRKMKILVFRSYFICSLHDKTIFSCSNKQLSYRILEQSKILVFLNGSLSIRDNANKLQTLNNLNK